MVTPVPGGKGRDPEAHRGVSEEARGRVIISCNILQQVELISSGDVAHCLFKGLTETSEGQKSLKTIYTSISDIDIDIGTAFKE